MTGLQIRAVSFGLIVHVARFAVILFGLWLAPLVGVTGWYLGLFVNVLCAVYAVYAVALVTYLKLWKSVGFLMLWRGRSSLLLLAVPFAEAVFRVVPNGLTDQPPGFGLWTLTLLLVGFNEELISRGVVLGRLSRSFTAIPAVAVTAALFGLQHLSAFATTDREAYDVLTNVLASATYGFALAAFQYRFSWIWPLIVIHGLADFTSILARTSYGDLVVAVTSVIFVIYGLVVLRPLARRAARARFRWPPEPRGQASAMAPYSRPATAGQGCAEQGLRDQNDSHPAI